MRGVASRALPAPVSCCACHRNSPAGEWSPCPALTPLLQVMLDGHDIRDLQLRWYRHQLGLVSQEPVLFRYPAHHGRLAHVKLLACFLTQQGKRAQPAPIVHIVPARIQE